MSLLKVENIYRDYDSGKKTLEVLRGVNLSVKKGEFAAIVGPSGAGKSTLLHIIGGLDSPSQGKVILEDTDIYALKDESLSRLRNERIGFVFQFYHLLAEFTVLENVLMPVLINNGARDTHGRKRESAQLLLEQAGLGERTAHFPSQLSGGEKQRVAIVRALVNRPQLLLCDEPTGNLDSETGSGIIGMIKSIHAENEMAILLVTHNAELARQAHRIYHLKDGILVS